jgi:serine/threonine-protein kinase
VPVSLAWLTRWRIVAAAAIVVVVVGLAFGAIRVLGWSATQMGGLTIETTPSGITVLIDGATRGVTPIDVALTPGAHAIEVGTGPQRRLIPVTITAGGRVSQVLDFSGTESARGELQVHTDPASVSVIIDGRSAGLSPLTITDLAAGPHTVVLGRGSETMITEQVLIQGGRTASLVVSMGGSPRANVAGWIAVVGAPHVRVYEKGQLLGDSAIDRIMVPVGRHELEIVNETLGYRELRTVQVSPGQVSTVTLSLPQGSLALNAIPWAEVSIDGQRVGETPLGNVPVAMGEHEITFRHPDLGERRSRVMVKPGESLKVGVDLRTR